MSSTNTRRKSNPILSFLVSGWLWGTALIVAFYAALPYSPIYRVEAQRYLCAHWIEYATTWLFGIGMATLLIKSLRIPAESAALRADVLDGLHFNPAQDSDATAQRINHHLSLVARQFSESLIVRRICEICDYVRARRSANGIEGHLNYLAELACGRLNESYALIRTITWAVPILGFLGTVIGITMAIANVTPDQLSSSLNEVTAGLAVAFDTTALSLALSMVLVFTTFIVERSEQAHLDQVEDYLVQRLTALFPAESSDNASLIQIEGDSARKWLEETETLIAAQRREWDESLAGVRQRWTETLDQQQQILAASLQSAATQTLTEHANQLADLRHQWSEVIQNGAAVLSARWEDVQRQWLSEQTHARQDLMKFWDGLRGDFEQLITQQHQNAEQLTQNISSAVADWQSDLRDATGASVDQLTEIRRQSEILTSLVGHETELVRLEERMARNLETVGLADSLEETVLNLNAAVHLLTARTLPKAA